ncbi:hypothetical protein KDA_15530 [Dictyobacter alpinus]|uniref:Uncharacterized protein n=1 Tax=Dictyobacter alpinus TaxID=2014873 RepID=A0A402B3Z0_9CHLR|nr:hypothetical protein [Dictyobacter alpinus]GCE26069.1 hypothetical protein KDA_15530 [Dictyobacter alpinus]
MNGDPSKQPYRPNMRVEHDAPTEMFQANVPPANYPYQPTPGAPFNPGQRPTPNVRPEQLINRGKGKALPPGPLTSKIAYLWRSDPAYRVLFIAIGAVVLCSIIGVILIGNAFSQFANPGRPTVSAPTQTNTQPANPTPDTQQTSAAKVTPTATPQPTATPTLPPTPTPIPTQAPQPTPTPAVNNGPLTAQFSNVPGTVDNHTTVNITVITKPGAAVSLVINYTATPAFQQTQPVVADANGVATIPWTINERGFNKFMRNVTANMIAVARDQNNQQSASQGATVRIKMGG